MRLLRLVLAALLPLMVGCGSDDGNGPTATKAPATTTTTADPVDRAAVDGLVDQIGAHTKIVLKAESGEVTPRQLTDAANGLIAIAEGLKDPAKRPRGVPPKALDDVGAALAATGDATANLARGACPAGISTPRCTDLYLRLNDAQTTLITAVDALQQFSTRTREQIQGVLYG